MLACAAIACAPAEPKQKVPILYGAIDTADVPSLPELLRPIECARFKLQLRSTSRALRPRACELVQQLWSSIRDGDAATIGVSPGDTAQVRCGLVTHPFVVEPQKVDPRSAAVSFGFSDRGYSVGALVDTAGRITRIERSEGLYDCPAPAEKPR